MSAKDILVICYTFPPSPGIGGRRWAKFAKYLSKDGYAVHVASAQNLRAENSFWNSDIEGNKNIKPNYFKFQHQQLLTKPRNFFEKVIRKLFISLLKLTKYSEIFITSFPNRSFWKQVETIIDVNSIRTVIVSGDPFLFYYASRLKKKLGFRLILDYRDLWNDHSFYSTYVNISASQKKYFEFVENEAINHCDKIVVVDDHLRTVLSRRLKQKNPSLFEVVHNGFDPTDFPRTETKTIVKTDKIKLFFSGNISSDKNEVLLHFIDGFKTLHSKIPEVHQNFELHFHGNMDADTLVKITNYKLSNLFISNASFPLTTYTVQLAGSDAGMLLVSKDYPHSFYTKFTDYLYLNKFIVAIGHEGELSRFLVNENIGSIYTLSDDYRFFIDLQEKIRNFKPKNAIKDRFDLNLLTKKYIRILES